MDRGHVVERFSRQYTSNISISGAAFFRPRLPSRLVSREPCVRAVH